MKDFTCLVYYNWYCLNDHYLYEHDNEIVINDFESANARTFVEHQEKYVESQINYINTPKM